MGGGGAGAGLMLLKWGLKGTLCMSRKAQLHQSIAASKSQGKGQLGPPPHLELLWSCPMVPAWTGLEGRVSRLLSTLSALPHFLSSVLPFSVLPFPPFLLPPPLCVPFSFKNLCLLYWGESSVSPLGALSTSLSATDWDNKELFLLVAQGEGLPVPRGFWFAGIGLLVFTVPVVLWPAPCSGEDFHLCHHSQPEAWRMTGEIFERGRGWSKRLKVC